MTFHPMKRLLLICLVCSGAQAYAAEKAAVLIFIERESGAGQYMSRVIASKDFLRLDYGEDQRGFVLFDRKNEEIFSVNVADQTIMIISRRKKLAALPEIKLTQKQLTQSAVDIDGTEQMTHRRYFADQNRCIDSFNIVGFLPDIALALGEYYTILAGEHAETLGFTPDSLVNACDVATHIIAPARHFDGGMPIREFFFSGKERVLLDVDPGHEMDFQWHELPKHFRRFSPAQMRGSELDA